MLIGLTLGLLLILVIFNIFLLLVIGKTILTIHRNIETVATAFNVLVSKLRVVPSNSFYGSDSHDSGKNNQFN